MAQIRTMGGPGLRASGIRSAGSAGSAAQQAAWPVLLAVAGLVVATMLDLANYVAELLPGFPPKLLYFPMFGVCVAVLAGSSSLELGRVRAPILLFFACYCLVNVFHALLFDTSQGGEGAKIAWSRVQFLALAVGLALTTTAIAHRTLARLFALSAVLVAVSMLFDFAAPGVLYDPMTPGAVPGRVGSFFINANKAGEVAVLTALLATPALSRRTALPLAMLVGAAVFVTFSRTAMVAWVLMFAFYGWCGLLQRTQVVVSAGVVVLLIAGGGLVSTLLSVSDLPAVDTADISRRLSFLGTGDLQDDSGQERGYVLTEGLRLFGENLVFGAGAGATHLWEFPVAPHNQPVLMSAEYGIVGLVGWLMMVGLVATGGYYGDVRRQVTAAAFVVMFSMATHNMLDFPYWMVALLVMSMRYREAGAPRPAPTPPRPRAAAAASAISDS